MEILNNTNTILGIITGCITIVGTAIGVIRFFYKTKTEIREGYISVRPGFAPGWLDLMMALATAMFSCFVGLFVFGIFANFIVLPMVYSLISDGQLRTIAAMFVICFFGFIIVVFALYNARSVIRQGYQ